MEKQKIEREFTYDGLGFPVIFRNVPMVEFRGTWHPDIDFNLLQKTVLVILSHHPSDLTGNQVYFIRTWLNLTQVEFGKILGVTHPAVVRWEKSGNSTAKINLSTQRDLRLFILDHLLSKDEDFRKAFKRIIHTTQYESSPSIISLDIPTDLIAF